MQRHLVLAYGLGVYLLTLAILGYLVGFVSGVVVPRSLDTAPSGGGSDWLVNLGLLGVFAVQHMIMARRGFKRWITRVIPRAAERSTFVLMTCGVFVLMFTQWRGMPGVVWSIENESMARGLTALSLAGWGLVVVCTFLIDHFDLFGVKQVLRQFFGRDEKSKGFGKPSLYRVSRHPMYVGFFIAFWSTPHMTFGHLLFAGVLTAWVVFEVITFEEPDLVAEFGESYRSYQNEVGMFLPVRRRSSSTGAATAPAGAATSKEPSSRSDEPPFRAESLVASGSIAGTASKIADHPSSVAGTKSRRRSEDDISTRVTRPRLFTPWSR